jgi:hypothetical protein
LGHFGLLGVPRQTGKTATGKGVKMIFREIFTIFNKIVAKKLANVK